MHRMKRLFGFLFAGVFTLTCFAQNLTVTNLRCEDRHDPIGVDAIKPAFSWELQSGQRNIIQTAYRILVADEISLLQKNAGNIWDSKKVISRSSIQVAYNGKKPESAKKYFWKVMVWDNAG